MQPLATLCLKGIGSHESMGGHKQINVNVEISIFKPGRAQFQTIFLKPTITVNIIVIRTAWVVKFPTFVLHHIDGKIDPKISEQKNYNNKTAGVNHFKKLRE